MQLFDGKFTTGWKIVDFQISLPGPLSSAEAMAKISTEPKSDISTFDWADVQEFAWASTNAPAGYTIGDRVYIAEDNMAVEDLWIAAYTTSASAFAVQYMITLEEYTFPAWTGAGILVENLSQAGPQ
jgi:hypothetical protein